MKISIDILKPPQQQQKPNFFQSNMSSPSNYFSKNSPKPFSIQNRNQSVSNELNGVSNFVTMRKNSGLAGMHLLNRKKSKQFSEYLENLSLFKSSDDITSIKFKILENIKIDDKSN